MESAMTTPTADDIKVDIALTRGADGVYDVQIGDDGDFVPIYGFDTSIIMDLLCEERASDDEVVVAARRRGWIGNESSDVPGFEVGSKLWLQYQKRQTSDVRNAIVDAAKDALAWYVPVFCKEIRVSGLLESDGISLSIDVVRKSGKVDKLYFRLWELTGI
jgi:phage gp46-like protein